MKWKYTLNEYGATLRDAIDSGDISDVLRCLSECYMDINRALPKVLDEDELDDVLSEIDNQLDNYYNYDDYDMTYDDVEDEVNYLLNDFYDFCDENGIWIGLKYLN